MTGRLSRAHAALGALALVTGALMNAIAFAQAPGVPAAAPPAAVPPDQLPTPRDAQGHPSLVGVWNAPAPGAAGGTIINVDCNSGTNREKCKTSDSIDFIARGGT